MNPVELLFTVSLALVLLGVAGYFGWRQRDTVGMLQERSDLSDEDRAYFAHQVARRLLGCVLMVIFAAFLVGWLFLEPEVRGLELDPEDNHAWKESLRTLTSYWISALLVLLGIVALAGADLFATARFGLRQRRAMQNAHRDILAMEVARLRQQREERES